MRKFLLLYLMSLYHAFGILSQQYNFQNFSFDQGLTQSQIQALCQDKRGILWIGTTGGLFVFDGISFKNFTGENGLTVNNITSLYEHVSGDIWIGTNKGVFVYNGKSFELPDSANGLTDVNVSCISGNVKGDIWIGTASNGLIQINNNDVVQFNTSNGLSDNTINSLLVMNDTSVWMATNKGVNIVHNHRIDFIGRNEGLPSNYIKSICKGLNNEIWLATANRGLCAVFQDTILQYTVRDGLSSNYFFIAFNDNKGNLWFGSTNGLTRYNRYGFKVFTENAGLAGSDVHVVLNDFSGNTWFGTSDNGLYKFDNERFMHFPPNDKLGHKIFSLIKGINGNIIFGSSKGGITVYYDNNFQYVKNFAGNTSAMVDVLFYDSKQNLWLGTQDKGLYKFRTSFSKIYLSPESETGNITSIEEDSAGYIWIGTLNNGIYRIKNDSLVSHFNNLNSPLKNGVQYIKTDTKGKLYIATAGSGLFRLNKPAIDTLFPEYSVFNASTGLSSNIINAIEIDETGTVYLATDNGVNIVNKNVTVVIKEEDGLVSGNITAIKLDDENNLWVCTDRGVEKVMLDHKFNLLRHFLFGKSEGFIGVQVYRNAIFKDNNGDMWFGTLNGAMKYAPWEDIPVEILPKIHITGIKLFYEDIVNTEYADSLSAWFNLPVNLELPYKANNLTFNFNGVYHRNPGAVKYRWMLEGMDENYTPPLYQREASYSGLSPGKYSFKVIAGNENQDFTPTPATFSFIILPPFWQTIWFKLGLIAFLLMVIVVIILAGLRRVKKKNKAFHEKLEMEKSLLELEQEAARLQMNPHFIFNSLNSIQGFIATNDAFQAKRYLAKFARLMRLILENAREEFIPLQNEIDILDNYLELEKLSTNNKFDFIIEIGEKIEPETMEIPPMMIQPFVENAIVHGIKKKEGRGKIDITFNRNQNLLICEITDDGVGRKHTGDSKITGKSGHKSTGISVTKKRIEQYKIQTGVNAGVEIVDLMKGGKPAGTKIILSIPYESF